MLGTRTPDGRMEGGDESTVPWRHPKYKVFYLSTISLEKHFCKLCWWHFESYNKPTQILYFYFALNESSFISLAKSTENSLENEPLRSKLLFELKDEKMIRKKFLKYFCGEKT